MTSRSVILSNRWRASGREPFFAYIVMRLFVRKRSELRPHAMMRACAHFPRERSLEEMELRSTSNHEGF